MVRYLLYSKTRLFTLSKHEAIILTKMQLKHVKLKGLCIQILYLLGKCTRYKLNGYQSRTFHLTKFH